MVKHAIHEGFMDQPRRAELLKNRFQDIPGTLAGQAACDQCASNLQPMAANLLAMASNL